MRVENERARMTRKEKKEVEKKRLARGEKEKDCE